MKLTKSKLKQIIKEEFANEAADAEQPEYYTMMKELGDILTQVVDMTAEIGKLKKMPWLNKLLAQSNSAIQSIDNHDPFRVPMSSAERAARKAERATSSDRMSNKVFADIAKERGITPAQAKAEWERELDSADPAPRGGWAGDPWNNASRKRKK